MKRSVTARYALFQGAYWASGVLVYGYTRVFLMNYGCSAATAGLVLALGSLAAAFLQPLLGTFMHKQGLSLRTVLFSVTALGVLCAALMLFPLPAPVITVFFTLLGVVTNSTMGFLNAAGFALQKEGETLNFPVARAVGSVTYAIVSKLMSALSSSGGLLACYIGCAVPLAVFALTMLPKRDKEEELTEKETAGQPEGGFFARNKFYLLMLAGQTLIFFMHHILTGYVYDIAVFCGGTEADMGTALSVGALAELPGMLFAGRFMKKHSPVRLLQASAVLYCLRTAMFLLRPTLPVLYALEVLQMVTFAFLIPSFPVFVERYTAPGDKLRCQTLNTGTNAAAGFLGFLFGGMLVDGYGIFFTLKLSLYVSIPGAFLLFFFAGRALKNKEA